MTYQTATERLRQLLDERGEHYKTSGSKTWWGRPVDSRTGAPINVYHNQAQPMGKDRLFVEMQLATPEQAVEATLGRGTCRMERVEDEQRILHGWLECSECGPVYPPVNDRIAKAVAFCPFCGAKVVGPTTSDAGGEVDE